MIRRGRGKRLPRGIAANAPSMATGTIVAPLRRARAQKPGNSGCSRPSLDRVPSGNTSTASPSLEQLQRRFDSAQPAALAVDRHRAERANQPTERPEEQVCAAPEIASVAGRRCRPAPGRDGSDDCSPTAPVRLPGTCSRPVERKRNAQRRDRPAGAPQHASTRAVAAARHDSGARLTSVSVRTMDKRGSSYDGLALASQWHTSIIACERTISSSLATTSCGVSRLVETSIASGALTRRRPAGCCRARRACCWVDSTSSKVTFSPRADQIAVAAAGPLLFVGREKDLALGLWEIRPCPGRDLRSRRCRSSAAARCHSTSWARTAGLSAAYWMAVVISNVRISLVTSRPSTSTRSPASSTRISPHELARAHRHRPNRARAPSPPT